MLQPSIVGATGRGDGTRFFLPHLSDLAVQRGVGALTFTRNSGCWDNDFENKMVYTQPNCASFPGMRPVTNLFINSEDSTVWSNNEATTITTGQVGPDGKTNAVKVLANNGSGIFKFESIVQGNNISAHSIWLRGENGGEQVYIGDNVNTKALVLNKGWTRYGSNFTIINPVSRYFIVYSSAAAQTYYVAKPQIEDVTWQSNRNPGEYVATGATPVTKWFSTINPHYVPMNRLTYSEDFGNAVWGKGGTLTGLNNTFTIGAADGYMYHSASTVAIGEECTVAFRISGTTGKKVNAYIMRGDAGYGVYKQITLSGTPTEYSLTVRNTGNNQAINLFFHSGAFRGCPAGDFNLTATVHELRMETGPVCHEYYKTTATAYTPSVLKDSSKRRVENVLVSPEDLNHGSWIKTKTTLTTGQIAPDGSTTATKLTFADDTSELVCQNTFNANEWLWTSTWIKGTAGETVAIGTSGTSTYIKILTGEWERLCDLTIVTTTSSRNTFIGSWGCTARVVTIWHPMVEIATGYKLKIPSEYATTYQEFDDAPVLVSLTGQYLTILSSQIPRPAGATNIQVRMGIAPDGFEYYIANAGEGDSTNILPLPTDGSIIWVSTYWYINGTWSNAPASYYAYKAATSIGANMSKLPSQVSGMSIEKWAIADKGGRTTIKTQTYMQSPTTLTYGPNLVTNGDFSNGTTGWTATNATMTVSNGEMDIARAASTIQYIRATVPMTAGKQYRISLDAKLGTGDRSAYIDIQINGVVIEPLGYIPLYNEYIRVDFTYTAGTISNNELTIVRANGALAGSIKVKNISIQEVTGLANNTGTDIAPVLGSELVVNGDFSSDTWWTKSAGTMTISGGTANFSSSVAGTFFYRPSLCTVGTYYQVTYTVSSYTSGEIYPFIGSGIGRKRSKVGTYTDVILCGTDGNAGVQFGATFTGAIDNVSIKEIIDNKGFALYAKGRLAEPAITNKCTCYGVPRADALGSELITNGTFTGSAVPWNYGASWSYAANAMSVNGVLDLGIGTGLYRDIGASVGKVYEVTFTVTSYTSGTIYVGFNSYLDPGYVIPGVGTSGVGTFTFRQRATSSTFSFVGSGTCVMTIDTVSVKEVYDAAVAPGTLGPELIPAQADREFTSDTGWWTKQGTWTISGGMANHSGAANYEYFYRAAKLLIAGRKYRVSVSVYNYTSGAVQIHLGNANGLIVGYCTSAGTFVFEGIASGDGIFCIVTSPTFVGSIDNVSIKAVLDDRGVASYADVFSNPELITVAADRDFSSDTGFWGKGGSWTISGGTANVTTANSFLQNGSILTVNKTYEVTYTIKNYVAGSVVAWACGVASVARSANGTYTERIAGGAANATLYFVSGTSANLSIDDVSCKEVTFTQNITNMTLSGDHKAILTVVKDQAEIESAGLSKLTNDYKVYKLDNSLGSTTAQVRVAGTASNTNTHTVSAFIRGGSGTLSHYNVSTNVAVQPQYRRVAASGASAIGWSLDIAAALAQTMYFIVPQFEEYGEDTSVIPTLGGTANRLVTAEYIDAVTNVPHTGEFAILIDFTLNSWVADYVLKIIGNGTLFIYAGNIYLYAGIIPASGATNVWNGTCGTLTPYVPHKLAMRVSATNGVKVYIDGVLAMTAEANSIVRDFITAGANISVAPGVSVGVTVSQLRIKTQNISDAELISITA